MATLEQIASDEQIREEYRKSFLLNLFQKTCIRMDKNQEYRLKNLKLFRQSHNTIITTRLIVKKDLKYDLTDDEALVMSKWMMAYFMKSNSRKRISCEIKKELFLRQKGLCVICGEKLGDDWSKIHIDHIIPWTLVGDELEDNYQLLCNTCNQCKSSKTDYIFKSLLGLN